MKKIMIYAVVILCLGVPQVLFSQQETAEIKVLALKRGDHVKLRWGPTSSIAWLKLNKYGYEIERITVKKNGKLMPPSYEKKVLDTVAPQLLKEFEKLVDTNNYALVIAQLIYGKNSIEAAENPIQNMLKTKKSVDNKYSYVLLAADMDFEAATMAGLGYKDTNIEKNVVYLYRIKSLAPKIKIKTGLKLIDVEKEEILPAPVDLFAMPEDKKITLTWDKEIYKSIYTAYHLEKSEDGLNFDRINGDTPYVNFNHQGSLNKQMFFTDSITENYKKYYYRLIGISAFGEKSSPSKTLSAKGISKLAATPKIVSHKVESLDQVLLNWEFDKEADKQIKGFSIDWASKHDGPYTTIKRNIPKNMRSTTIHKVEASNYYKINALGISHQKTTSLMHFVQPVDSIPPKAPVGLTGTIDSLGVVHLSWQANTEKDILGYMVFKANLKQENTIPANAELLTSNSFTDTISIAMLNSKVYYQVMAMDNRYNQSDRSEKVELKKPDIIPPTPPVFKDFKVDEKGISLFWINSSDDDVVSHQLYRKDLAKEKIDWQPIFETDTITNYVDHSIQPGSKYRYAIFAVDDSQLKSEPSTPLTITANMTHGSTIIKGFSATADRASKNIKVSWRKMPSQVAEILIYRSKNEDKPMLWKQLPAEINELIDTRINPDNTYTYILKTIFDQGTIPQTKSIEVIY